MQADYWGAARRAWLEVAVKVAVRVDVRQAAQDLRSPAAHLRLAQVPRLRLHELVQVALLHFTAHNTPVSSMHASCMFCSM